MSLIERNLLAGRVFWFYLGKLVWPADLAFDDAVLHLYEALRLDPGLPGLHRDLAFVLQRLGRTDAARHHAMEASRMRAN